MTNQFFEFTVSPAMMQFFRQQAEQKIQVEGWGKQGRHVLVKVDNFVHCWITEEAFKQLLIDRGIWFRHRGLYFGDAQGAGADFTLRVDGKEVTIGLRSVAPDSLYKWRTVAYPNDRFETEQEKIADYHVVCNHDNGISRFFGIIAKRELLKALQEAKVLYSKRNQERFRVVPLAKFEFEKLRELLEMVEKG
jgi:hypothetical protein